MTSTKVLTNEQLDAYSRNGYIVIRGYFSPEKLAELRPQGAPSQHGKLSTEEKNLINMSVVYGNVSTGENPDQITKLEGIDRLRNISASYPDSDAGKLMSLFDYCATYSGLEALAKQVIGEQAEIMKDKYIFKKAGGGSGFLPHQDMTFIYNRVVTEAVNFGIAFDDADSENGALEVCTERYAETHRNLLLPSTERAMENKVIDHLKFEHVNTKAGDVIMFSGWLLHRSTSNVTTRDRNVYYITYGEPGIPGKGKGELYSSYYELYDAWIKADYPVDSSVVDLLLGADKTMQRPTLIPPERFGTGIPQ